MRASDRQVDDRELAALRARQVTAASLDVRAAPLEAHEWEIVEAAARDAYQLAGMEPPDVMIRAESPYAAMVAGAAALQDQPPGRERRTARALVAEAVLERPTEAAREVAGKAAFAELLRSGDRTTRIRGLVNDAVGGQVSAYLSDEAGWPQTTMAIAALTNAELPAATARSALLDWAAQELADRPGLPLWDLRVAACSGLQLAWSTMWFPHAFIACDRPSVLDLDVQGELHGQDSPAVEWSDGWSVSAWHGTPVPADFYLWDASAALAERNAEIRRCAMERLGWASLISTLEPIDVAPDPGNPGHMMKLYRLPAEWDRTRWLPNVLVVSNASLDKGGARRTFVLKVPPWHRTALSAAADLFGLEPAEYAAIARAT